MPAAIAAFCALPILLRIAQDLAPVQTEALAERPMAVHLADLRDPTRAVHEARADLMAALRVESPWMRPCGWGQGEQKEQHGTHGHAGGAKGVESAVPTTVTEVVPVKAVTCARKWVKPVTLHRQMPVPSAVCIATACGVTLPTT